MKLKISLFILLSLLILASFAEGKVTTSLNNSASIILAGWKTIKWDNFELNFIIIKNITSKQICISTKPGIAYSTPIRFVLINNLGVVIFNQTIISTSGKWCFSYSTYTNLKGWKLIIGEGTIIEIWDEQARIQYLFDWGESNLYLSQSTGNISDLWILTNKNGSKCGAVDGTNIGIENYTYILNSTAELITEYKTSYYFDEKTNSSKVNFTYPVVYNYWNEGNGDWNEKRHVWNFFDICKEPYSKCKWKPSKYSIEINFASDRNIDPTILPVTACATLNTDSGYYELINTGITNNALASDCIIISASNIIFNLNGSKISSDDAYTGIYTNYNNVTILNGTVNMSSTADGSINIELVNANNTFIKDITTLQSQVGVYATNVKNLTLNNTFINNPNCNQYCIAIGVGFVSSYNLRADNLTINRSVCSSRCTANTLRLENSFVGNLIGYTHLERNAIFFSNATYFNFTNVFSNSQNQFLFSGDFNRMENVLVLVTQFQDTGGNNKTIINLTANTGIFISTSQGGSYYNLTAINSSVIFSPSYSFVSGLYVNNTVNCLSLACAFATNLSHNYFEDILLGNCSTYSLYLDTTTGFASQNMMNNTFINMTFNRSKIYIEGGSFWLGWWYMANITTPLGIAIQGANITGNTSGLKVGSYSFNITTGSNGLTNRTAMIESNWSLNASLSLVPYYVVNWSFNVTNGIYENKSSYNITASQNVYDWMTLGPAGVCSSQLACLIDCCSNPILTTIETVTGNITLYNSGCGNGVFSVKSNFNWQGTSQFIFQKSGCAVHLYSGGKL